MTAKLTTSSKKMSRVVELDRRRCERCDQLLATVLRDICGREIVVHRYTYCPSCEPNSPLRGIIVREE